MPGKYLIVPDVLPGLQKSVTSTPVSWDQKKVVDRESMFIPRKITATIHSLKNPNHDNKISYRLPNFKVVSSYLPVSYMKILTNKTYKNSSPLRLQSFTV